MPLEEKEMPFNLFHKKKRLEQEVPPMPPQPEVQQSTPTQSPESNAPTKQEIEQPAIQAEEQAKEEKAATVEPSNENISVHVEVQQTPEVPSKTYLKAMPLRELSDLNNIKDEVKNGNIIILRVTPLAGKSIEDVKTAVNDLFQFADSIGGDIARLGEERVVITPKTIRIWREKTPVPVSSSSEPLPTAA
jgi:SepF-like predicted cell division protein (DUF552 family)